MTEYAGDYQNAKRMGDKLRAIPLPDFRGKTVFDIGTDHGFWAQLASERGASRIVGVDRGRVVRGQGFVDLTARNNAQNWPGCEFITADLGVDWPQLGVFDIAFAFSVYHHLYAQCGDHQKLWQWFADHVRVGGLLLWEGPPDETDSMARQLMRTNRRRNYTRVGIRGAADQFFRVTVIGPALHRAHREVWSCIRFNGGPDGDPSGSVFRSGSSAPGIHGSTSIGYRQPDGLAPVSGNAQPETRARVEEASSGTRAAVVKDRAAEPTWGTVLVAGAVAASQRSDPASSASTPRQLLDGVSRDCITTPASLNGESEGRRPGLLHPEWAVVLGGAACIWKDVQEWEKIYGQAWDGLVIASNDIGCHWPKMLDHWISLHPEKFKVWCPIRTKQGFPSGYTTWGRRKNELVHNPITAWAGGSTGLLAAQLAYQLGCQRIVLCGVPMTPTPHFLESTEFPNNRASWTAAAGHWKAWEKTVARFEDRLRSMSGRTRELVGFPSREWIFTTT